MPFQIMTTKERLLGLSLAVWLGGLFAYGFLPLTRSLFFTFIAPLALMTSWLPYLRYSVFPLMTGILYLTLPGKPFPGSHHASGKALFYTGLGATLLALVGGLFFTSPEFSIRRLHTAFWLVVCTPIGEEWLFRGWVYRIFERLWPNKLITGTNPLTAAVFFSSVSFSIWHLQNLNDLGWSHQIMQLVWTLYLGFWLGYLRWNTGKIWPCILGHFSVNLAFGIPW